jgi:hypothetical protein
MHDQDVRIGIGRAGERKRARTRARARANGGRRHEGAPTSARARAPHGILLLLMRSSGVAYQVLDVVAMRRHPWIY